MALSPRLDLRQSQSLVMTPQLQQAIKLLQMSHMELSSYIKEELEKNPLLDVAESQDSTAEASRDFNRDDAAGHAGSADTQIVDSYAGGDEAPLDQSFNTMDEEYGRPKNDRTADAHYADGNVAAAPGGDTSSWHSVSGRGGSFSDDDRTLEDTLADTISLNDHLMGQLVVDLLDPIDVSVAQFIVNHIDENGYLATTPEDVALALGCDLVRVDAVLDAVQRCDPAGIGARSLQECLALQLHDKNRLDPAMEVLLAHLDMLAKQDLKTLMDICGVDQADLADMIADIRMCNPKPGQAFRTELITTVVPDVLLQQDPAGGWHVELNGEALPKILVNNTYYAQISRQTTRDEDKTFITEAHQTATWLVKSLHQRATTILKVATEIVRQQDMFFAKGVAYLKPLVLRDVAEVIGMHESTVSRVTSNKYIETPRGIYELKYFFTQAIASADGQAAISAEAVRHKIKTMIDGEDPKKILSDDKLVELLKADGIDIARRTVAKYREALKIPSSVQRRKQKKHLFSNA